MRCTLARLILVLSILYSGCHALKCTDDPLSETCMQRPAAFLAQTTNAYDPNSPQVDYQAFMDAVDCLAAREHRACSFFVRHLFHDAASVEGSGANARGADATVVLDDDEGVSGGNNQHGEALTLRYALKKLCAQYHLSFADGLMLASIQCSHRFGSVDIPATCKNANVPLLVGKLDKFTHNVGANNLPDEDMTAEAWINFWMVQMNAHLPTGWKLTIEEAAALMGSHNIIDLLGCAQHTDNGGAFDTNLLRRKKWDNAYYQDVMSGYVQVLECDDVASGTQCKEQISPDRTVTEWCLEPLVRATPADPWTCAAPCTPNVCSVTKPGTCPKSFADTGPDGLTITGETIECLAAATEAEAALPIAAADVAFACPFGTTGFQAKALSAVKEAISYRANAPGTLQGMPAILLQRTQWYPDSRPAGTPGARPPAPCFNNVAVADPALAPPQCAVCRGLDTDNQAFCFDPLVPGKRRGVGAKFWEFTTNDGHLAVAAREGLKLNKAQECSNAPNGLNCQKAGLGSAYDNFSQDNQAWQTTYATAICKLSHIGAKYSQAANAGDGVDLTTVLTGPSYKGVCRSSAGAQAVAAQIVADPPSLGTPPQECSARPWDPLDTQAWGMCDDGNSCTADTCPDPYGLCSNTRTDATCVGCTAANPCPAKACHTASCTGGVCKYTPIDKCCTSAENCKQMDTCIDYDCINIDQSGQGTCSWTTVNPCQQCTVAFPTNCDDGNPCTADVCGVNGRCQHIADSPCKVCKSNTDCADNVACSVDTCTIAPGETQGRCTHNYDACTVAPGPGDCTTAAQCNDNKVCTKDTCVNNRCVHTIIANCCTARSQCTDNNACTNDKCTLKNRCTYAAPATRNCAAVTPAPKSCTTVAQCNDRNPCTTDSCTPMGLTGAKLCQNKRRTNGSTCQSTKMCMNGVCVPRV